MPDTPYFEDLLDSADFFEFNGLHADAPLMPVEFQIDEFYHGTTSSTPEGRGINVRQINQQRVWKIAFINISPDNSLLIRRFFQKGMFYFWPKPGIQVSVKWVERQFQPQVNAGGWHSIGVELFEIRTV